MVKYKFHVVGNVQDTETDFRCAFNFTVENGGSLKTVGSAIQGAIDAMKEKGHPNKEQPIKDNNA